jgi:hypothetical protein
MPTVKGKDSLLTTSGFYLTAKDCTKARPPRNSVWKTVTKSMFLCSKSEDVIFELIFCYQLYLSHSFVKIRGFFRASWRHGGEDCWAGNISNIIDNKLR